MSVDQVDPQYACMSQLVLRNAYVNTFSKQQNGLLQHSSCLIRPEVFALSQIPDLTPYDPLRRWYLRVIFLSTSYHCFVSSEFSLTRRPYVARPLYILLSRIYTHIWSFSIQLIYVLYECRTFSTHW